MEEVTITPEVKPDVNLLNAEGDKPPVDGGEKLFAGKYKTVDELKKGVAELYTKGLSEEDIEKKYKELESGLGAPKGDEGEPPVTPQTEIKIDETPKPDASFQPFFEEFAQKGELSEESYKALEAKGLSKGVVDSYIEGQKLQLERQATAIYDSVGGQEKYGEMTLWAKDNLTEDEILAFNQAIVGTPAQAKLAAQGLALRYSQANKTPNLVMGGNEGAPSGDVYESRAQMITDMQSQLYKKDPAERKRVAEKLGRSKIM